MEEQAWDSAVLFLRREKKRWGRWNVEKYKKLHSY